MTILIWSHAQGYLLYRRATGLQSIAIGAEVHPTAVGQADYRVLHHFAGGAADGAKPVFGKVIQVGSSLYGTSEIQGAPAEIGLNTTPPLPAMYRSLAAD